MGYFPIPSSYRDELPWELSFLGRLFIHYFLYSIPFCNNLQVDTFILHKKVRFILFKFVPLRP